MPSHTRSLDLYGNVADRVVIQSATQFGFRLELFWRRVIPKILRKPLLDKHSLLIESSGTGFMSGTRGKWITLIVAWHYNQDKTTIEYVAHFSMCRSPGGSPVETIKFQEQLTL